ncbi:MAG: GDP-L-fucose synthase [Armatimonadota bacterium]|nr:GDP-L-fucose synthase [Armatimonadota bacterium]
MTIAKDAKIYVAGHTGLVGSSIARRLTARGYDNLLLRTRREVNLTDAAAVSELMRAEKPDLVILTAGKVGGIQANIGDPVGFLVENLRINDNVICAALEAGVRDLLYTGSSCMYPKDYNNPLKEEYLLAAPLEPTNEGYALAKISGAKLCEYCGRQYGVNYKTLIPCNLYGPGDHFRPESSHLIAAIVDKIRKAQTTGAKTIEIWGDGSARREFLYIDDLTDFMCDCLEFMDRLPDYLNVGYGKDHSVLDYYTMAAEALGWDGEFTFDTSRPVGMATKLLDSSRAYDYGWNPRTGPTEGIRKTYEYHLSMEKELVH